MLKFFAQKTKRKTSRIIKKRDKNVNFDSKMNILARKILNFEIFKNQSNIPNNCKNGSSSILQGLRRLNTIQGEFQSTLT